MSFPQSLFVSGLSEIPRNFVKFGDISDSVEYWHAKPDIPIYFAKVGEKLVVKQGDKIEATFFRWYKFWHHLDQLLDESNKDVSSRCRLVLCGVNMYEGEIPLWTFCLSVFVDKQTIQDMYNKMTVPKLLFGIIHYNSQLQRVSLHIPPAKVLDDDVSVTSGEFRPYFVWQQENVRWMRSLESVESSFALPIIGLKEYNIYRIKSVEQYIVFKRSRTLPTTGNFQLVDLENHPHTELTPKGGLLLDDVGLGKTYSIIGLMRSVPKKTLVICPNRLCKQWFQEITSHSNLKAWIVADIRQYRRFDEKQALFDVIICPISILTNTKCLELDGGIQKRKWERAVVDEAHECLGYKGRAEKKLATCASLYALDTDFTWLITGTPTQSKAKWLDYINIVCKTNHTVEIFNTLRADLEKVIRHMSRRNTKASLEGKIHIPPAEFENCFLDQTMVEKYIYQSALGNQDEMVRLCTHVLVSERCYKILGNEPVQLSEIHRKMIDYNTSRLSRYQRRLELLVERHESSEGNNATNKEFKDTCDEFKNIIAQSKARVAIFQDLESRLKEQCAICMEDFKDVIPVVGACGHLFCAGCLSKMFQRNSCAKCPICREPMHKEGLNVLKQNISHRVNENERYGTKMARLISYLENVVGENDENRIIVFSQWDKMLKLIAKVLEGRGIKHVLVKGSAFQAAAKIRKFKIDKDIRVILLSSEKASSGLNLTETSHIALVDTVNGETEKVHAIEDQAVGRSVRLGQTKQVKVTRFIMRDTVEYDFFQKNFEQ
jgi:hypothetical protein